MSENKSPITDPQTGRPIAQKRQPGYYPKWDVMKEYRYWDAATRAVVTKRLEPPKPLRFFTPAEAATITATLDRVLPQDDRLPAMRIPLLPPLDERLFEGRIEGYRYDDMPSDRDAYRLAAQAFEAMAQERFSVAFTALTATSQEELLQSLADDKPAGAKELWGRMSVKRFWSLLVSDACSGYYAHPWSWNEVGFGGPAYPRGYMRIEEGLPEPWEFNEERYEWAAPADSISQHSESSGSNSGSNHGQTGTH